MVGVWLGEGAHVRAGARIAEADVIALGVSINDRPLSLALGEDAGDPDRDPSVIAFEIHAREFTLNLGAVALVGVLLHALRHRLILGDSGQEEIGQRGHGRA